MTEDQGCEYIIDIYIAYGPIKVVIYNIASLFKRKDPVKPKRCNSKP